MKFYATLTLIASYAMASLAFTVATVEADVQNIASETNALYSAINAFPNSGESLLSALAIHTDALNLGSLINKGTSDVNGVPKPVSDSDGNTILTAVQKIEPLILGILSGIVAEKATFQALPFGGGSLVLQDLQSLSTSTSNFEAALIAAAPVALVPTATAIKSSVDAAFASAIAAFS